MKLSSRSKHGLRAMVELALNEGQGPMLIKTIAERAGISNKYIEQLIAALKISGLVRTKRGPHGGYFLGKQPSEIKLSQIFTSLEGPTYGIECTMHTKFSKGCDSCVMAKVWSKIHKTLSAFTDSTTLQDLIDMKK